MTKIPRLKINTSLVLNAADSRNDLTTYASDIRGIGYVTDGSEILVVTGMCGYLRIKNTDIETLISELRWIVENNERFGK